MTNQIWHLILIGLYLSMINQIAGAWIKARLDDPHAPASIPMLIACMMAILYCVQGIRAVLSS